MATRIAKRLRVVRDGKEEADDVAVPQQQQQQQTTSREDSQADSCTGSHSGKNTRAGGSASTTAARREQNRVSQEKSRNKREERTSLLEAQVRLQSYNDSAQCTVLLKTISVILHENTRLRELLGQCSSFIGQGHGGELAGFGVSNQALQEAINADNMQFLTKAALGLKEVADYAQDQAAFSAYGTASGSSSTVLHKDTEASSNLASAPLIGELSSSWANSQAGASGYTSAKSRSATMQPDFPAGMSGTSVDIAGQPPVTHTGELPAFIDRLFSQPLQNSTQAQSLANSYLLSEYLNPDVLSTPKSSTQAIPLPAPLAPFPRTLVSQLATQAAQLMEYQIRLKHQNASYNLPACLERTLLQRSVPYDACIDRVIWPSMRDKLISRQYEQQSQATSLSDSVPRIVDELWSDLTVHPSNDLLDVQAWEISEDFVLKHPMLVDVGMLQICNKWRMARNDTIIVL